MGVHWGLMRVDETTNDDLEEEFQAEPWDPWELDLVLLGKTTAKGPVTKLCESVPEDPASREGFSSAQMLVVPIQAIQKCAERLGKIERFPVVSAAEFARYCTHSIQEGDEQAAVDDVAERVRKFRDFIFRAVSQRWKLRFWCG
jgi:hypothetical protein